MSKGPRLLPMRFSGVDMDRLEEKGQSCTCPCVGTGSRRPKDE